MILSISLFHSTHILNLHLFSKHVLSCIIIFNCLYYETNHIWLLQCQMVEFSQFVWVIWIQGHRHMSGKTWIEMALREEEELSTNFKHKINLIFNKEVIDEVWIWYKNHPKLYRMVHRDLKCESWVNLLIWRMNGHDLTVMIRIQVFHLRCWLKMKRHIKWLRPNLPIYMHVLWWCKSFSSVSTNPTI